jgi:hypothetical protein
MQHFLTYILKYDSPSNLKATLGTTVHKVCEQLANVKKFIQDNPEATEIEIEGFTYQIEDFYKLTVLDDEYVDKINKTRINKQVYLTDARIKYGHTRMGVEPIENLIDLAISHYESKSDDVWTRANKQQVYNWTWMVLDYLDGAYNPLKQNIVEAERNFDILLDDFGWASYNYSVRNPTGETENIEGKFRIRGTVDLITSPEPSVLEVVDYKTGRRISWSSGEEKDYNYLKEDHQLLLYYYAILKLYPEYEHILITIFFIRDGGPYTIHFDKSSLPKVEAMLKEYFESVRDTEVPSKCSPDQSDFRCQKLCHFYKTPFPGTNQNTCAYIHNSIKEIGIDETVDIYRNQAKPIDFYSAPGA